MQRIYFDNNATTPMDDAVITAMQPFLNQNFGNASSLHEEGRRAKFALEMARRQIADTLQVDSSQIVFTSGGTEANNLALEQVALKHQLAVSQIEHESVLRKAEQLAQRGVTLTKLPVDEQGLIHMGALQSFLGQDGGKFVSVMYANNETGVIQDISAVASMARDAGAVMHTDAVQALGKLDFSFGATGVQLMSVSAHKIHGPKGVGALIFDKAVYLEPMLVGGGHENRLRAGTENIAAIVGFGAAAEQLRVNQVHRIKHLQQLMELLQKELNQIRGIAMLAPSANRIPNTLMMTVPCITGETLVMSLDQQGVAVSSGSACGSHRDEPSHLLSAIGLPAEQHFHVLRISLGHQNTMAEVRRFCRLLAEELNKASKFADLAW